MGSINSVQRHSDGALRARASLGISCILGAILVIAFIDSIAFGEIVANLQPYGSEQYRDPLSYSLADINAAGGIIIGDKLFKWFDVTTAQQGGALAPNASGISIRPIQVLKPGAPFGGDYGMIFVANWQAYNNQSVDTTIEFNVSILEPYKSQGYAIKDNALWIVSGSADNATNGGINITESLYSPNQPNPGNPPIATESVYYQGSGNQKLLDSATFAPVTEMWVVKDVGVSGGDGLIGSAHLSQFYQTFSQVPEPSSVVLLVIGAAALGGYTWRKRRGAA